MDGMIGDETEMREEIKREAQIDMIGTKQGHLVRNLMIVHTGLLEIPRKKNGRDEMVKAEKDLEKRLRHFYALVMMITGNRSLYVVYTLVAHDTHGTLDFRTTI